ncbi:putative glycosyltransferase [Sphingobium herbicidovorans NBRC 16415]|uniref:Glycosyltransferase n=1 Tax=Sphingobium herbicidovorans (strain ATCC 700291 / DSM 11019 / CCUG 56400 / KCTC 2939 / LMG 18315 / NBRC 16415 / MH) TaxID=1219045 RepID=A0A086P6R9_SPHHM|nr:glycosyltransferase [Sphingobium herbicidovorans]KFG89087.1 putative glycosyltransferase [Sphingobium herbicidovorans NBRC 16415]
MIQNLGEQNEFRALHESRHVVQKLMIPDAVINNEQDLFFHRRGMAGFDQNSGNFYALPRAEIRFDSYFNAFPSYAFDLQPSNRLEVHVATRGKCIFELILVRPNQSRQHLFHTILDADGTTKIIEVPQVPLEGLIYARFVAIDDLTIRSIDYVIAGAVRNKIRMTGVITTFKRNDAVQKTAKRLEDYFAANLDLRDDFNLLVIDNGGDTDSIGFSNGRVIKNSNYGGAGGFTRGLLETVKDRTSTHVLFMDDDAVFFPETLRRTMAILRYAADPALAISGSMITESHKWRMWEASATFNRRCMPIHNGRDLRQFPEVVATSQIGSMENRYGGWWYFCFPIAATKTWPFPFFVRGDDICFSLANDFRILNVPGIASHQEDFFAKQSPMTVYLDMRYHLVAHLMFERLELSKADLHDMMRGYFDRFNDAYHYESAEALLMAMEDVLKGERFWEDNLDMAQRRADLAALTVEEKLITPLEFAVNDTAAHSPKRNRGKWRALWRKLSFNGHILPEKFFYSKGVLFPLDVRANPRDSFRRRWSVTFDAGSRTGYICRINKARYFANRRRFKIVMKQLLDNYAAQKEAYRRSGQSMTTQDAWERRFKIVNARGIDERDLSAA